MDSSTRSPRPHRGRQRGGGPRVQHGEVVLDRRRDDVVTATGLGRRATPLRALEARAMPGWLGCTQLELAAMASTAVALGIACADVAATTAAGRVGLFSLGAATGAALGCRVEALLRRTGLLLRWLTICGGFVLGVVALGAVVRWVA